MAVYENGTLYVDNSTLATLATCPTKAMVRYGYNLKPRGWSTAPLQAGIAIHKAIEAHYTEHSLHEVLAIFKESYFDWAVANVDIGDRLGYNNVEECVESWIVRHPIDSLPYVIPTPEHVEMPFDFPLNPNDPTIRYVGRVDALVGRKSSERIALNFATTSDMHQHLPRNALYVLDTKSSGAPYGNWTKQFELSPQMTGYTWAAQNLFPDATISGIYINVVHTYMIPRESGKCSQHKTDYSECRFMHPKHQLVGPILRTRGEIEEWRVDAYNLAHQWKRMLDQQDIERDLNLVPQFGKWVYQACALCELFSFCRAGRDLNAYDFEEEAWVPGDLATR